MYWIYSIKQANWIIYQQTNLVTGGNDMGTAHWLCKPSFTNKAVLFSPVRAIWMTTMQGSAIREQILAIHKMTINDSEPGLKGPNRG